MTARFIDTYAPETMPGYPCVSMPNWSTQITRVESGSEQANQRWQHPLHTFTLPQAVRKFEDFLAVQAHWYAMRGPAHTWPFRDPLDFASVPLAKPNTVPAVSGLDCLIGTGDDETTDFQLVKRYTSGPKTYDRKIHLPILSTLLVTVDGIAAEGSYTADRTTGVVSFEAPPTTGAIIKAGFLFDVQVRFESDESFSAMLKNYGVAGYADITLVEVRGPAI